MTNSTFEYGAWDDKLRLEFMTMMVDVVFMTAFLIWWLSRVYEERRKLVM
jgi:hypothetical protein